MLGQVLMALSRSWWILAGLDGSWQVSVDLFVSRGDLGWPQWVLGVLVDLNISQELGKCILKFSVRGMSRLSFNPLRADVLESIHDNDNNNNNNNKINSI